MKHLNKLLGQKLNFISFSNFKIGPTLKRVRLSKNKVQINIANDNISQGEISAIETGRRSCTEKVFKKYLKILEIQKHELIFEILDDYKIFIDQEINKIHIILENNK